MNKIELIGQIADLKESNYKTNLLLASLIEVLIEQQLLSKEKLSQTAFLIDYLSELEIVKKQINTADSDGVFTSPESEAHHRI